MYITNYKAKYTAGNSSVVFYKNISEIVLHKSIIKAHKIGWTQFGSMQGASW